MGYPDVIFPPDRLAERLGERISALQYRHDSKQICGRHGIELHMVPDAESLLELYGASLDVYDVKRERGGEIVLDLNEPYPKNSEEQYDWVLDVGTLEHCFNVAQAVKNMASLLKVGGTILHENPFNWGNHGFYSLHPTWFHDFYEANGFEIESCRLVGGDLKTSQPISPERFVYEGGEVVLITIVHRREVKSFAYPQQRKYQ